MNVRIKTSMGLLKLYNFFIDYGEENFDSRGNLQGFNYMVSNILEDIAGAFNNEYAPNMETIFVEHVVPYCQRYAPTVIKSEDSISNLSLMVYDFMMYGSMPYMDILYNETINIKDLNRASITFLT